MELAVVSAFLRLGGSVPPGWRDRVCCRPAFEGTVHLLADSEGAYVVAAGVRGPRYPDRAAGALLEDLCGRVWASRGLLDGLLPGALPDVMQRQLRETMETYDS